MSVPTIPPRPARSQGATTMPASAMDIPRVPARPKRNVERSVSPNRDSFARSPLNNPSFLQPGSKNGYRDSSRLAPKDVPRRPPSVDLPSIGQEGQEYASLEDLHQGPSPPETKKVAGDIPLHAPKASLPPASAKQRIATVTRTDSSQAAAMGIGKATSEASEEKGGSGTSSATPSRPASLYKERSHDDRPSRPSSVYKEKNHDEHGELGIPEIGVQVPMYPNAGDVQAPTPSPYAQTQSPGIGFFNNGSQGSLPTGRHHSRTKSGREIFHGPPGSYGMHGHGHGLKAKDPFEKAWYDKHPDALAREAQGEYGPAIQDNRKEWALSSEELNKLVHSEDHILGMGVSPRVVSTPAEEIGYLASEEYASRMASPKPSNLGKPRTRSSQTHTESPLRRMAFPVHEMDDAIKQAKSGQHDAALDSEVEDDVIHVDPPERRQTRMHGGVVEDPKIDLGPHGGNTEEEGGWVTEEGYGAPILASDEVAKHPEREWLQPAVDPNEHERDPLDSPNNLPRISRPSSRTSSLHGAPAGIQRFWTPEDRDSPSLALDEVKEYEPLFPEEEERAAKARGGKAVGPVDKLKRPDLARHHFPSQDIWEDTPDSLKYTTTVDSPQLPDHEDKSAEHEPVPFESPQNEAARKQQLTQKDKQNFISDHTKKLAKSHFPANIQEEMKSGRPGLRQRFPSQDIWEDAPDHVHLVTTVDSPRLEEASPIETKDKPQIPGRPTIPTRPQRPGQDSSPEDRKAPTIPGRPKPQIPARPGRAKASDEKVPQVKSMDGSSASPPKAKPAVPARPAGGKLAALQANFMSDLNKRLQLGPQAPPKVQEPEPEAEEEKEKAPLVDARKGRARGPARRKPTSSASPAPKQERAAPTFSVVSLGTVWQSNGDDLEVLEGVGNDSNQPSAKEASTVTETDTALSKTSTKSSDAATEATEVPLEKTESKDSKDSKDEATQTGQLDIAAGLGDEKQKMTAYLGGDAQSEGDVLVKDDDKNEPVVERSETAGAPS